MKPFFDRPALLLTLTALFWAGNSIVGRAIVGQIPPVTLAFLRWTLATLIFLPFALTSLKRDFALMRRNWIILLFLSIMGAGSYNTLFYLGLVTTEAVNALVLGAASPMFVMLMAWGLFGDPVGPRQLFGIGGAFLGVLFIVAKGDVLSLTAFRFNSGDLLIIVSMITWSIYTAFLRKRPPISWQSFNIATYAVAAAANLPLALIEYKTGQSMAVNTATAGTIIYVAIFPSLLAYVFYNRGVELVGPTRTGLYMFLIPMFGAGLASLFLGERLHLYHAVGFALIIGGVLIGNRQRRVRITEVAE